MIGLLLTCYHLDVDYVQASINQIVTGREVDSLRTGRLAKCPINAAILCLGRLDPDVLLGQSIDILPLDLLGYC